MTLRAVVPASVALFLMIGCGLMWNWGDRALYMDLLTAWGVFPVEDRFVDTGAVLSAIECHRAGMDVYQQNPCDVYGRIHVYSPLWLAAAVLPVTAAWTPLVGLGCVLMFLFSLVWLPPGRDWWQTGVITLATVSGSVAFAIERANIDIIVFVLATLTVRLVLLAGATRFLGYGVALLAGALKFYPATLLILAVRERLTVLFAVALASAAGLAGFAAIYGGELKRVLSLTPTGSYFSVDAFSARDLPYGLAGILNWPPSVAPLALAAMAVGMFAYAVVLSRRGDLLARVDALEPPESAFLMVGCVLMLACFLTAQNVLYRGIHLLFVMPGLLALARGKGFRPHGPLTVGCGLVVILLWADMIRRAIGPVLRGLGLSETVVDAVNARIWAVRELTWWAVATMLATLLIALLLRAPATRELAARFTPRF